MKKYDVVDFANDMREHYGRDLDLELEGNEHKVKAFFRRVKMVVMAEIKMANPMFRENRLNDYQKEHLWDATLEQAYYMLNNYDMNIVTGYDPISNSTVPIEEVRKRAFSPLAKTILRNAGLMYAGVGYGSIGRGWR